MKTNLFIAALSLVVLAGCSGEDESWHIGGKE